MSNHHLHQPTVSEVTLPAAVAARWVTRLAVAGALGIAAAGAGFLTDRAQFYHSYLVAFSFCLSLTLGCLFFTVVQHIVGAHWSVVVRRIAENVAASMGLLVVLLIPVLVGMHDLYHWTHAEAVASDHILQWKEPYLSSPFFLIRLAVYFGIWLVMARFFVGQSLALDKSGDAATVSRLRAASAPAILLFGLTQTFAAFDLLMSLDPHWFSTIFGVYFFAGSAVSSFSLIVLIGLALRGAGLLRQEITVEHYHDLGKLMFGFTVFWTYIAFSQYFLIWYANMPEETLYFIHRWDGTWKIWSLLLFFGHFVFPFIALMSKHVKRNLTTLGIMATWIVFIQFVDMYWLVMPGLHKHGLHLHWMDAACMVGLVGIWGAFIVRRMARHPLIPIQDPLLQRSLEFENV